MSLKSAIVAGSVLVIVVAWAPKASAQSTLVDGTCVVVSGEGLFMIANQVTTQVFDVMPFGGSLAAPSVTWIDGTDTFIVTTRDDAVGNPGGLWRVTLAADGTGTVADLTPTMPAWIESRFIDADYAPGFDLLFLLQGEQGVIASWADPAHATLATLAPWGSLPPGDARSIAVNGAKQPFAIVAVLGSGPVLRVDKLGTQVLYATGSWDDISGDPVTGYLIVSKQKDDSVGQLLPGGALMDYNVFGFCGPLVPQPMDVEWDPVAGHAVAIAGHDLAACAASFGAVGINHIVRLPIFAGGPPGDNDPVLLTPMGSSGITGKRCDLALVRNGGSEVSYWGFPSAGAGTSQPTFKHVGPLALGKSVKLQLADAPPSAAALLVLGLYPAPVLFQGQLIMPAPMSLLPALTSSAGAAQLALKLPAGATAALGFEVYMQWIVDDSTTPAAGDIASSQAAVFTIGLK